MLAKYHIDSIQEWEGFSYEGTFNRLDHLNVMALTYEGKKDSYDFVVTYGLHCFAKDNTEFSIPIVYADGRESKQVDMERYNASKNLPGIISNLIDHSIYQTTENKFFMLDLYNSAKNITEPYKVALAFFKENRLMRIHVTSAFFAREGEGSVGEPVLKKPNSIFKISLDLKGKPRNSGKPKEANNRPSH